jgi:hypothetical protein
MTYGLRQISKRLRVISIANRSWDEPSFRGKRMDELAQNERTLCRFLWVSRALDKGAYGADKRRPK